MLAHAQSIVFSNQFSTNSPEGFSNLPVWVYLSVPQWYQVYLHITPLQLSSHSTVNAYLNVCVSNGAQVP